MHIISSINPETNLPDTIEIYQVTLTQVKQIFNLVNANTKQLPCQLTDINSISFDYYLDAIEMFFTFKRANKQFHGNIEIDLPNHNPFIIVKLVHLLNDNHAFLFFKHYWFNKIK